MKSSDIIDLLKLKHRKDVCVEQCKIKPSWDGSRNRLGRGIDSPIMDLWVLPRKWKGGEPICYEVKVSRSDLFHDHKFPDYWKACNWFYFAVPNGMVKPEEMERFPPQCGFIEANSKGTGMTVRRKPCFMAAEIDPMVYRYVLMWRTEIVKSRFREIQRM